jgi:hypothetical protein
MRVIAGSRNVEICDINGRTREGSVSNSVVVEPRLNLQPMPVSEWVTVAGVSLRTHLDLLFKAELIRQRELPGDILDGSGDRVQHLRMQGRQRK